MIANGDGRFRLASITADRLAPLGYIIDLGDALQTVDATIIYYRPGFDDEAAIVANDIAGAQCDHRRIPHRRSAGDHQLRRPRQRDRRARSGRSALIVSTRSNTTVGWRLL